MHAHSFTYETRIHMPSVYTHAYTHTHAYTLAHTLLHSTSTWPRGAHPAFPGAGHQLFLWGKAVRDGAWLCKMAQPPTTQASEPPEPACSGRSAPQVRPEERGFLSAQKCSPATSTLLLSCLEGLTGAPTHQRCACCPGGGRWSSIPSLAEQTDGKLGSAVSGMDFPPGQVQVSEQNTQPPRPPDMQLVELFLRLK